MILNLWVPTPFGDTCQIHCIADIYIMVHSHSRAIVKLQENIFITWRAVWKGGRVRKVENHCLSGGKKAALFLFIIFTVKLLAVWLVSRKHVPILLFCDLYVEILPSDPGLTQSPKRIPYGQNFRWVFLNHWISHFLIIKREGKTLLTYILSPSIFT